ncbi:MAG TPA: WecB/TagA/CpsF family glycosyltransferase [Candidatus Acidoferrales bacterium]|nr:WecB/TagA/CpsF family glycosyltransferase [Candidatus Acidoferrales bacterium]
MTAVVHDLVATGLLAAAVVALGCSAYLVMLSVAAFFHRSQPSQGDPAQRLLVIVPAHDEACLIERCLASLQRQTYPRNLYRIIVVADNCTDSTSTLAAAAGAEVMVRTDPDVRGKGRALRWAIDRLLSAPQPFDAVVIVDADSVADPGLLWELAAERARGSEAVQAEYLVLQEGSSLRAGLKAAALLLFHRVRFSGQAALGFPCNLVGNGMLISRAVLESMPWDAFTSTEDLEYSLHLRYAGVRPRFAAAAKVAGPVPARGSADQIQRIRWEGGRFNLVRIMLGPLLRASWERRDVTALQAALDLSVPPLGLLFAIDLVLAFSALILWRLGVVPTQIAVISTVPAVGLVAHVLVGLVAGRAPAGLYLALLASPIYVLAKLPAYRHLARSLDQDRWQRTRRPSDEAPGPSRYWLGTTPIDAVRMNEAVGMLLDLPRARPGRQVCTVNLHFLAVADTSGEMRDVLRSSALNLPDGHPPVWLGRMAGHHVPARVAGSDLVPLLAAGAAETGKRIFLLGGEDGVAAEAARRLREKNPGLQVAHYEPASGDLESLDSSAIVELIDAAETDLLLVALGHPKQELWISRNLGRLNVAVAIGVGCALDLVAGRRTRAPGWMRATGLEWLYRLAREPRRLLPRYAGDAIYLFRLLASGPGRRRARA